MFPNVKIVLGGILLSIILLAATGSGMVTPQTYTRIGEMPEIGRPMMQQMFTDQTAQARFHILTLSRRTEELDRLRDLPEPQAMAEVPPDEDLQVAAKPAVAEIPDRDAATEPILTSVARVAGVPIEMATPAQPATASPAGGDDVKPDGVVSPVDAAAPLSRGDQSDAVAALAVPQPEVKTPLPFPASAQLVLPRARPEVAAGIRAAKHRARPLNVGHRLARAPAPDPSAGLFGAPLPQMH